MSIKRTIITTILALALVATVAPATTQATTIDDLLVQIASLQAQLVALQGGSSTPVPTGIVACSGVTFTRDLTVGATGSDVKCLQVLLNTNGYTLATAGAGSPGMETSYFGPITLSAVRAFQAAKGWTPANQVGPLTRAALNTLIGTTPTTPVTPTAGCPAGAVYNSVTGALCTVATPGATGFIDAGTLSPSPADNANVITTSNVPVLGLNVKAIGSNMTVTSAKVQLAISTGEHPANVVQNLYVYDGSTLLGSYPVNTSTVVKTTTTYYLILSGFNFMVPVNTTKVLTVTADFNPSLETSRTLTVNLVDTSSLRAVDGAGVYTTGGVATARTYVIAYATVGTSTLAVTTNVSTLDSTSVNVNHTSGRTDVPMFIFSAKSSTGASTITDLVLTAQGDATGIASMSAVKLYDGSTLLGSVALSSAVSGATATFTDLSIPVAKDATKTFTVKADFSAAVTQSTLGVNLSILIPAHDVTFDEPNLTSAHPTASAAVSGNAMYLYDGVATTFTLVSASSLYEYNSTVPSTSWTTGTITLKVHSDGGTTVMPLSAHFTVNAYRNGSSMGAAVTQSITVTPESTISDGSDAVVVINLSEPVGSVAAGVVDSFSGTGAIDFRVDSISWQCSDGTLTSTEASQDWGISTFKTPTANAQ